jgi:hypothetical protein
MALRNVHICRVRSVAPSPPPTPGSSQPDMTGDNRFGLACVPRLDAVEASTDTQAHV